MPRRREVTKREILPDPKYKNALVARFINNVMERGKKSVAEGIFYGAMDLIQQRTQEDPLRGGGFTGIDVGHDADVPRFFQLPPIGQWIPSSKKEKHLRAKDPRRAGPTARFLLMLGVVLVITSDTGRKPCWPRPFYEHPRAS